MTLLNIIQFHPLRDTLPDGTEVRLVLPVERTNNKPLYITSDGRPFSHVRVKDKTTGDYRFEYHPIKPIFDTSKTNKFNANRKQKYLKMNNRYGYILIHHAVALAFIGPRPVERLPPSPKFPAGRLHPYDCHHLNGITTDNRPENLIWLSPEDHRHYDARQKALRELLGNLQIFERSDFDRWHAMPEPDFQAMLTGFLHDPRTTDEIMQYEMSHHMEI